MGIDITQVAVALIGLLSAVITAFMIPLLKNLAGADKQAFVAIAAKTAVYAAQQLFGSEDGQKKKDYALQYVKNALESKRIKISADEISAAIEAALKEIKMSVSPEMW